MYHLRLKGSHYEAGFKRGSIFKKFGVTFPIKLDNFQKAYGEKAGLVLKKYFPEGYEEVKGITDALNINYDEFLSWMMCMGCCMYNLDDNIPVVKGCTALAFTHQGKTYYGRNNDLPPFLKKSCKAEIYTLNNTPKFYMTTSSFVNGEEGMNEKGLVVAMTFVMTDLEEIKPGFNTVFIVRYLLEKATNTKEAINLLYQLPIASNGNILIADKSGEMVVCEISPEEINIRGPIINSQGEKFIVTTNEFTSSLMKEKEAITETYESSLRYEVAVKALNKLTNQENPVDYTKALLKGDFGFMCQYDKKDNFVTVWSSLFDLDNLLIYRAEGDPRKAQFKIDERMIDN